MVDSASPTPQPSQPTHAKPFGLRALVYTIGFLAVVLGIIPSVFYFLGEMRRGRVEFWAEVSVFWRQLHHLVGIAVFSAGLISYSLCSAWLIFHGKGPHVEFDPPKTFVATGPYKWVRNPVVITLIITAIGEAIFMASIGIAVFVVLGMAFAQYQVTRVEEPLLSKRFGETYDKYCRTVPRWIPRPPTN
jgi:protein-S-isoprenylcysteine O-methyltransferase Ste14